jgi:hypothetical protein
VSLIIDHENAMRSQPLTTPTTFIVKAEVFTIKRETARLRAKALKSNIRRLCSTSFVFEKEFVATKLKASLNEINKD